MTIESWKLRLLAYGQVAVPTVGGTVIPSAEIPGCGLVEPDLDECSCRFGHLPVQRCCNRPRPIFNAEGREVGEDCCGEPEVEWEECKACLTGVRLRERGPGMRDEVTARMEEMMSEKKPGELPRAFEAKWRQASMNPGVPVDMGDVVVCDLCTRDYRGDPTSGGLIFQSTAVGPCCLGMFESGLRNDEAHLVRARCPRGVSFHRFVLDYRIARGTNSICIRSLDDVNKLREYIGTEPPAVSPGDGWDRLVEDQGVEFIDREMRQADAGIDQEFIESSDHPYTCKCDGCRTWWAKMGPDGAEPNYGPFDRDEVNARQRELGLEET